jgi:methylenetetrahydrofolate reductase (NADPH)
VKVAVQNLVRNYSIETTFIQAQRIARFADLVVPGTHVYIPHTPHATFDEVVALAARLRREGMEPVPHVVARRIENEPALESLLSRLTGEAGVRQVLVVAGDLATPAGSLYNTLQIFESGLLEKYKVRSIGVAGHPEGHPNVSDAALREALKRKNDYAYETGADVYVVTQFTFSPDPVIAWEKSHGSDIGNLPITAGLPGLATARTLLKYAMECGVGASLKAFSKRYASITRLLTISTPGEIIAGLARYKHKTPGSRVAGVHFFTFGGFQPTAEWANKVVDGNFEMTEDGGLVII